MPFQKRSDTMARGNGEGSIYFDKKRGKWRGTVTVSKGQRKSVYAKTKKECVQKMNELKADVLDGSYCPNSDLTVEEYLERMIENERKKNLIKDTTYRRKKETLKRISKHTISKMRIQAVTAPVIDDFLMSLTNYSNSVISKEFAMLKRCFEDNIPNLIKVSPMQKMKCPKSNKQEVKQRALTLDEHKQLKAILEAENTIKYKSQMLLMLYTGMRMGEINALQRQDVNLTFRTVEVRRTITKDEKDVAVIGSDTKTAAGQRVIPLTEAAYNILSRCIDEQKPDAGELIFSTRGSVISTNQVNMEFQRVCEKYDIINKQLPGKVSLHSLRHTYATRCIEGKMSAKVLQSLLGHTDIRITLNTYCDAFDSFKCDDIAKVENYLKEKMA